MTTRLSIADQLHQDQALVHGAAEGRRVVAVELCVQELLLK